MRLLINDTETFNLALKVVLAAVSLGTQG